MTSVNQGRQLKSSLLWHYSVALVSVAATLGFTLALKPFFAPTPFLLFYGAIAFCAWYGGLGSGLLATLLSAVSSAYFLLAPSNSFALSLDDGIRLLLFMLVALFIVALSTAQQRSERASQTQRERAAQLSDMAAQLSGALAPHDVAALILDSGARALGASGGVVMLTTLDGAQLEMIESRGYPESFLAGWKRISIDLVSPLTDAVRTRTPSWIQSRAEAVERYAGLADAHSAIALHAWANLPMLLPDRAVGALELSFDAPRAFSADDRAFLSTLSQLGAQALDRARLYASEHSARLLAEQARERADFLANISQLLVDSLDYHVTLKQVADLAIVELADWCAVDIVEDDGAITMAAVAHRDPAKVRWAYELREKYPVDPQAPAGLPQVLRSGSAEMYPVVSDDMLQAAANTPEQLAILRAVGYRSVLIVPLTARGRVLGGMTFVTAESEHYYDAADMAFAQDIADRAAVAIDNARLYKIAQQSRDLAESAVQLRDQFLSIAAHELKTPLTSLQLQVQLIERRAARTEGNERDRRAFQLMSSQTRRIDRMISALLDISRIEHGQLNIISAPLDLDALARRVIAEIQPTSEAHPIAYHCSSPPAVILGDELRLEQVLQNLLQNAIKYSPGGGPIAVELGSAGDRICLSVTDHGIGVPPEAIGQMFRQFYRAPNAEAHRIGGMGIGLYVVREIVQLHGGSVEVISREGQGSTFSIILPHPPSVARIADQDTGVLQTES